MAKTARNQQKTSKSKPSAKKRVTKRAQEPKKRQKRQPKKKRKSEITVKLLAKKHAALLADLELPAEDVQAAATKFTAFVELETLADKIDNDRLISSHARLSGTYRILPAKKNADPSSVVAFVTLDVGKDANVNLAKKREFVVIEEGIDKKKKKAKDDPASSQPIPPTNGGITPIFRSFSGFITNRDNLLVTVRVTCEVQDLEALKNLPIKLSVDVNTAAQKAQLQAISKVKTSVSFQKKLAYGTAGVNAYRIPPISAMAVNTPSTTNACLNEEQQLATNEMLREGTSNIFMLFGPPGTGKTFTLVKAITQLVRSGKRVLICAPTNKAADLISCEILNNGIGDAQPYLLHRHVSRSLDASSIAPQLRSNAGIEMNGDDAFFAASEVCNLDDYAIVVSTLGSTPALRKSIANTVKTFSHIVIDEAGQAPEMETWMPLAFFASESTRLIVAGDPVQLGPVAAIHLLNDPAYGYKTSILSRLYQNEAFRSDTRNMVQLTKNYRSHEAIVNVVSRIFYDNTLEYTRPVGHDSLVDWDHLPKPQFPVFFENVNGQVKTDGSGSSSNNVEANAVVFYIQSLLRWRVQAHEIGVVSPYTAQTQLIRRLLGPSSEVTVDTVEKYQGSERRVIIMTAVRNGLALGFMEDRQRLNTALSRAQQLLIVIGHAQSLETLPDWKIFLEYCKENNAYIKCRKTANTKKP